MVFLKTISEGNANVEAIRSKLFTVLLLPLYPPTTEQIKLVNTDINISSDAKFKRPESYGTYKNTGGTALGTLGKDFRPTQPEILLDAFVECLVQTELDLRTLKYDTIQGGKKVRFSIDLTPTVFKNHANVGDTISNKLILQTGFDGYTATTFQIETEVLKCTNGMVAKNTSAAVKFKNTQGNLGKIAIACEDISAMVQSSVDFSELMKTYDSTLITKEQTNDFIKATTGYDVKDYVNFGKIKKQRYDELNGALQIEFKRNGQTAWGLLNGITFATNHLWSNSDSSLDYLTSGGGLKINDKAQKFLNELVLV